MDDVRDDQELERSLAEVIVGPPEHVDVRVVTRGLAGSKYSSNRPECR